MSQLERVGNEPFCKNCMDIFSALCDSLLIKQHDCVAKETFDRIQWLSSNSHKSLKGGRNILGRNFSGRNKSGLLQVPSYLT